MRAARILIWVVTALLIGAGLGGSLLFEPPLGNLEGRLIARDSGHPVAAAVALSGEVHLRTQSDEGGHFSFKGIPAGPYRLSASSPGHVVEKRMVQVREGRMRRVKFEMARQASWVELIVHEDILYPGEPTSIAVRGLTLSPSYRLDVYRVNRWRSVREHEARTHRKALEAAVERREITLWSTREVTPLQIDWEGVFYDRTDLGQLPIGRYLVIATGETGNQSARSLTVSRLALLVKTDPDVAVAYVSDLMSGEPIEGASVTGPGVTSRTDKNGLARLRRRGRRGGAFTCHARVGDDIVSSPSRSSDARDGYRLFAFTDRPIYRPGDEVHLKGVLRKRTSAGYVLPGRVKVSFSVMDPSGTAIHKSELTTNDQGSFADSFTVPKEGKTGHYRMTSRIGGFRHSILLKVASYLKPELQLSARPERVQYVRGELAVVDIEATYYFGAPAADLGLRWMLSREAHYPQYGSYEGWDLDFEGEYYGVGGELVSEGEGKTDEAGRIRLLLPSRLLAGQQTSEESPYLDHRFTVRVWSTSDAGGSATTSASYLVTRGDFSLSISPDRYLLTPNKATGLNVEARDFEGLPVADQEISLSLIRETRPQNPGEVKRHTILTWKARTAADGIASTTVTVPEGGSFVLEAAARDSDGHSIGARRYVWAVSGTEWDFRGLQRGITIISDRKEYGPRDRVRLLVTTEHAGQGLFCLEGERLHETRPLMFEHGANMIEFDLKPEYLPNVQVWVGQVYDKRLHRATKNISISRDIHRLTVALEPGQPEYRPGGRATCQVKVTDSEGRPAKAEIAIGVVDEAIYALAEDRVQDPVDYFYHRRYNRVSTSFAPTSHYWGGGDKAPPNIEVRRRFMDTAFWAPHVLTDADGRAEVEFALPDNLTSWRVTARAVSADTRGGVGRANFKVAKPLMVRLDLPRFATEGDRFRVSAYVHNETERETEIDLSPWARGVELDSRQEQLTIPAKRLVRRDWWATVTSSHEAVIGASAVSAELQDAVELTLPVNPYTRTQFDAWSGQTEDQVAVILPLRQDSALDRTRLTVAVSPSIAASLFSNLEYLIRCPYGCVEQTVSSFLPNLYVLQLLEARGMGDSPLSKEIPPRVVRGLARLAKLQRVEGGWGWGRWGELDIWMTSYALLALTDAQRAGYQVAGTQRAVSRLESAVRAKRQEYPDDLAFTAYVLARLDSELALPTIARALDHPKLSGRGRALCALAYFELGEDAEAHRLMAEQWRTAKKEGDWTNWTGIQDVESQWWDGGANVEATAWALKAALRADPKDPRATSIASWLLHSRNGDRWVSTRDTAIALSALVDYLRGLDEPNPDYAAIVEVNGKEVFRHTFTSDLKTWQESEFDVPAAALQQGANKVTFSRRAGTGRLYYRANLRQQVRMEEEEETARGEIFHVRREYFKMGRGRSGGSLAYGPASKPGDVFDDGDRVLVRLTFNSSQRLRYVLIEDPLPAGLEPSARGDVGFMDWRSWWVDNDVRDDRVNFYLDWLPKGRRVIEYTVTARTPGRFNALPTSGFAMYQPKVNALGEKARIEVKP